MSRRRSAGAAAVVREFAPAKINLYLHVTGRRADGYHRLDSLVVFADLGDVVTARAADDLSLRILGPFAAGLDDDENNLVLRAARALRAAGGVGRGARLTLRKTLPVASGIGGGSADAAATLRALTRLWRLTLRPATVAQIALALGADVPACLESRAVFAGGIGERLTPAPALPEAALVLVNPGVALATLAVFRARQGPFSRSQRFQRAPADAVALAALVSTRRNDLTTAASAMEPAIADVLSALARAPGCLLARMSGSGATCFGLFSGHGAARRVARELAMAQPGWWVKATRLRPDRLAAAAPSTSSR